jgi:hypothetical protein
MQDVRAVDNAEGVFACMRIVHVLLPALMLVPVELVELLPLLLLLLVKLLVKLLLLLEKLALSLHRFINFYYLEDTKLNDTLLAPVSEVCL